MRLGRRCACRDVADEQLVGNGLVQQAVHIAQVASEQIVEFEVVLRRMIVAVPPEPVAPLGDQHFLAGAGGDRGVGASGRIERRAGCGQLTPGSLIVPVSDPDVEVCVDPGSGKNASQLGLRAATRLAHRHGSKLGMARETAVEGAQERAPAAFEVLPGVLTVEDDGDQRFSPAGACSVFRPASTSRDTRSSAAASACRPRSESRSGPTWRGPGTYATRAPPVAIA